VRARELLGALGLVLLAALFILAPDQAQAQTKEGPCFLFPSGTDWYLGPRGYHHGCEDGSCEVVYPIMGWDYIADAGIPVLSPLDGVVVRMGHDGVGNTVVRIRTHDGLLEFGVLHLKPSVRGLQEVRAGEQIGTNASIGRSSTPHAHVWFLDVATGENIKDHDQFWSCVVGSNPKPTEPPVQPPPEPQSWLDRLVEFWKELMDALKGDPSVVIPDAGEEPEIFRFSVSAQKPGDADYQHNVRAFFAWPTSGRDLSKMNEMDLRNFQGSWLIPPRTTVSLNAFFGDKFYEEGQGMRTPKSTKGIGDGSCNAASFLSYVLGTNGLRIDRDDPTHAPVPGVPQEWVATVCIPTVQYHCTLKDVRIGNPFSYPNRLHWRVEGDTISLWVEKEGYIEVPGSPDIYWPNVLRLAGVIMIFMVIFFIRRKPERLVDATLWVADAIPWLIKIFSVAWSEAKKWTISIIVLFFVLYPQWFELLRSGPSTWFKTQFVVYGWQIAAVFLAILANVIINTFWVYNRPKKPPSRLVLEGEEKSGSLFKSLFWLVVGVLYLIAPDLIPGPVDDLLVNIFTIWKALPTSWKSQKNLWVAIVLVVLLAILLVAAIGAIAEAINQAMIDALDSMAEVPFFRQILEFFGWQPPGENIPPPPPGREGDNPYYAEFVRASRFAGVPEEWALDGSLLKLVNAESGWNPRAKNPRSTAFGLFQLLESTHKTYVPEVPYGTSDPYWQAVGGFRYIKARYETPTCAWNFWRATVGRNASLACPEHRATARYWIKENLAGY
jgi:hypothetical protein